jgi:glucose/arabinose dehydrogenase
VSSSRASLAAAVAAVAVLAAHGAGAQPTQLRLVPVLTGLDSPLHVTAPRSEPNRLYVVEQDGRILVAVRGKLRERPFLDIRRLVSSGGERGLLSVAFHPRYATNRKLYVDYTDVNGDSRVAEYRASADRSHVLTGSRRQLMLERQPYPNHNGGQLAFGPDGLLYIGLGDGGSAGDPHDNGQTFKNRLAKIWKLDVDRKGAKPELDAYGLRNPWRFSFDRATGDLYIGDVGQGTREEVDYVPAPDHGLKNFGWPVYEGTLRYSDRQIQGSGQLTMPIEEYTHRSGCSITGGFVYRGKAVPDAVGRYFYGDYCSGAVWSLRVEDGKAADVRREPFEVDGLSSFGENAGGELYLASLNGTVYRLAQ